MSRSCCSLNHRLINREESPWQINKKYRNWSKYWAKVAKKQKIKLE